VAMLLKASLQVFSLLLLLLGVNDLLWILVLVRLGICGSDFDIDYVVGATGPEASQEDVSSVIFSSGCVLGAAGWA
jgi:hypothetical protein